MTKDQIEELQCELQEIMEHWNLGHTILITTCQEDENTLDTLVIHLKAQEKKTNRTIIMLDKITQELSKQSEKLN